ncbi:MAG: radical SAM protein [Acidobacteriota bacterium]
MEKLAAAAPRMPPINIMMLAAVLRNNGFEVQIYDAENRPLEADDLARRAVDWGARYVGLSTVTPTIHKASEVARAVKALDPTVVTIAGGVHASAVPDETMAVMPEFDVMVRGEGEETLLELLSVMEGNAGADSTTGLEKVDGISFRRGGEVIKNRRRAGIEDLDKIPYPAWDMLDGMPHYYRPAAVAYRQLPSTILITSRGCPAHCVFCGSRNVYGTTARCHSPEYVLGMIDTLQDRYGVKDFAIYDDTFLTYPERVHRICDALIASGKNITWSAYSRVDTIYPDLVLKMKAAGCWLINFGVESGSQRILDLIRKEVTLEQIHRALQTTRDAGIRCRGFFMVGHPGETEETMKETVGFLNRLPLDDFHVTFFTPLPGSPSWKMAPQYGQMETDWSKLTVMKPTYFPHGLDEQILRKYQRYAYRSFYFSPKRLFSYGKLFATSRHKARFFRGGWAVMRTAFSF